MKFTFLIVLFCTYFTLAQDGKNQKQPSDSLQVVSDTLTNSPSDTLRNSLSTRVDSSQGVLDSTRKPEKPPVVEPLKEPAKMVKAKPQVEVVADQRKPSLSDSLYRASLVSQVKSELESQNKLKVSGWAWMTRGQIDSSFYNRVVRNSNNINYNDEQIFNVELGIQLKRAISERTSAQIHINGYLNYPVLRETFKTAHPLRKNLGIRLLDASFDTKLIQKENAKLNFKFGYWSQKYNPEARNLGEYLFRSITYPGVLISGFEISDKVKVAGVKLGLSHIGGVHHDVFFTSETEVYPLYDLSLSYLLRYEPISLIDIGLGVSLDRIISADESKTIPAKDTSVFGTIPDRFYTSYVDDETGDTTNFTFAGTKLMGRVTLDPKWFFNSPLLGSEDLKLYSEVAILGVKNYPQWFDERERRIPVMFGFNIPTFKFLDVLAFEMEYYASIYANSSFNIWDNRSPVPYTGGVPTSPEADNYKNGKRDNWKWSVYLSKKLAGFLRISGQVANDHSSRNLSNFEDITQTPREWYWVGRIMFYL